MLFSIRRACLVGHVMLLFCRVSWGQENIEFEIQAPFLVVSPVTDGVISPGEYGNSLFLSFHDRQNPGHVVPILDQLDGQDEDLSLTMYLGHTDEFLFLGYDVTDDFLDLDEGTAPYLNDSIEVLIDADLDETDVDPDGAGRNWSLEGMQLIADAAGEGDIFLNNRFTAGNGPVPIDDGVPLAGEFYSAGLTTETGYVVEFQIPLGSLDTEDGPGETAAKTGDVLRMNNSITDNDDQGANTQDTIAVLWLPPDDPREPYEGGEKVWVVGLELGGEVVGQQPRLLAGDADQDLDFDQLDLVRVQIAAKYLTGQPATWAEGDWNGAPGGKQDEPPPGDGVFDQLDIIAALAPGHYLVGPYAALKPNGQAEDGQTSIGYNASTGEVWVDAPAGSELTSVNIDSAAAIFTRDAVQNLGGSFDNDADNNIFKATFGSSFGSLSFGNVAQTGLSEDFLLGDLSVVGSLQGGGALGDVDLIYIPEPTSIVLLVLGSLAVVACRRRMSSPAR